MGLTESTRWQFVSAKDEFSRFSDSWDALNRDLMQNHPMGDVCFVEPLIEYFATDRDFLAVRSEAEGPGSMLLLRSSRFGVVGSFCPSQTEFCPVLVSSTDALQSLIDQLPYSNLALQLYRQDPDYSLFPGADSTLACDIEEHASTCCVDIEGEFEDYWAARSAKLRKNMGRILRIIDAPDFKWRFVQVESPEEVRKAVERYGDLEVKGWKRTLGTAVHRSNRQGRFYQETMRRFAEKGKAVVYELYFDDCLVSSQLAIGNDNILITLKTTYNENYAEYSPGKLLDYLMLQSEFEQRKFSRIEFCTNAAHELIRWGTSTRPICDINVYRNRLSAYSSKVYRLMKSIGPRR